MEYDIDAFSHMYPVLNDFVYHYRAFKSMSKWLTDNNIETELWVRTCDVHLKTAVSSWCMIFGRNRNNPIHWHRIYQGDDSTVNHKFRNLVREELKLTKKELKRYEDQMISFRNEYVVHRELDRSEPVPYLDNAYMMAILFDKWVRELIKPDYMSDLPLYELSSKYDVEITRSLLRVQ